MYPSGQSEPLSAMQTVARARENADACERIFGRKLKNWEYASICQLVSMIEREEQEMQGRSIHVR